MGKYHVNSQKKWIDFFGINQIRLRCIDGTQKEEQKFLMAIFREWKKKLNYLFPIPTKQSILFDQVLIKKLFSVILKIISFYMETKFQFDIEVELKFPRGYCESESIMFKLWTLKLNWVFKWSKFMSKTKRESRNANFYTKIAQLC